MVSVGRKSFEDCFRAVASREVEYCLLPVENSLGGSIHENYDLMLRYDLQIVAEHEFRVRHCRIHKDKNVKEGDIKFAISHPQALAQCDNYLRARGIKPIPTYDTAGSAKMLKEEKDLPDGCTPENTCAIASDLAAITYGMHCDEEGIEDDDSNFTRFLLLSRIGVSPMLHRKIPSKTSIVFTLPESPGALYKALACFSLRDVDFSKIESRPVSASLLQFLKFRGDSKKAKNEPRFRYCFYLDFLDHELSEAAQNSLAHLKEQAQFVRVLGSYPAKSRLVGAIKESVDVMEDERNKNGGSDNVRRSITSLDSDRSKQVRMKIGFVGFSKGAQRVAKKISQHHDVSCIDDSDANLKAARDMEVEVFPSFDMSKFVASDLDIIVVASPLLHFEDTVNTLPQGKINNKLVVALCPLLTPSKKVLLNNLSFNNDVICAHPMLGETKIGEKDDWRGCSLVYESVRVRDPQRAERFLSLFSSACCRMVEMSAEMHDDYTSSAQFVTLLTGRLLQKQGLKRSPTNVPQFESLLDVIDAADEDTFDNFYGMYKLCPGSGEQMKRLRDSLSDLERKLAAKSSYIEAKREIREDDRQKMLAEVKKMLRTIETKEQKDALEA